MAQSAGRPTIADTDGEAEASTSSSAGRIAPGGVAAITERLAAVAELPLPGRLFVDGGRGRPAADAVCRHLAELILKDPSAFLARYGGLLQSQELNHFAPLRGDYEVNHWLNYWSQMATDTACTDPRRLPARVKNRRLAYMHRLIAKGEYFSDESMRQRAPLLYHQHIGRYAQQHSCQMQEEGHGGGDAACSRGSGGGGGGGGMAGLAGGLGGGCLGAALQAAVGGASGQQHQQQQEAAARGPDGAGVHASGTEEAAGAGPSTSGRQAAPQGPGGLGSRAAEAPPGPSAGAAGAGSSMPHQQQHQQQHAQQQQQQQGGLTLSAFLLRQVDEAQLTARRMQEQEAEDAQFSEHDSDEEEDDGEDGSGGRPAHADGDAAGNADAAALSEEELAQLRREFVQAMQSRFLLGQDADSIDYAAVDGDASLDGDWLVEEGRDAEERYFDED